MNWNTSLRLVLALAISLGLSIPATFAGWQTIQQKRSDLYQRLSQEQQRLAQVLSNALGHSLWNMDLTAAQVLLESASEDNRIISIQVWDEHANGSGNKPLLPGFFSKQRITGKIQKLEWPIQNQQQEFGRLYLEMDSGQVERQLAEESRRFVWIALAQLALSLGLIYVILDLRFIQPIKRLLDDSARLARRDLEQPFEWRRGDELGALGQSLEVSRQALNRAFLELEESEARFKRFTYLSSDWYWERDVEGRMTLISQGFCDFCGRGLDELLMTKRSEMKFIEIDADVVQKNVRLIEQRLPFEDFCWKATRPDGTVRHGCSNGEPIFDKLGNFQGYRGTGKDITNERLFEEAQQSTRRLLNLVEHLPAGALYIEDNRVVLNRATEKLIGFRRDEITTISSWFEKLYRERALEVRELYEADKLSGFSEAREVEVWRKDGESRWVEFTAFADEYSEVWILHDVTERHLLENELRQTLQQQQAIFNNTRAGIEYVKDRIIVRCNRGFEEILGYQPGELIGKETRIYYRTEQDWTEHGRIIYGGADGQLLATEWLYKRKDGSLIWCSVNPKYLDEQHPERGAISVTLDINDRKMAEAAFQQAYAEHQIIFENANAGIFWVRDERIMRCNRRLETMLGYSTGEMTGLALAKIFPDAESYERLYNEANLTLWAGQVWQAEWLAPTKNGASFWFAVQGKMVDTDHPEKGSIWIAQDESKRKQAEIALLDTKHKLELSLRHAEKTKQEVMLLSELTGYLQACIRHQEVYAGLRDFIPRLFPDCSGGLFLRSSSGTLYEQTCEWGAHLPSNPVFIADDCWALRRGMAYKLELAVSAMCCKHVLDQGREVKPYICLPLTAHGETLGVLMIQYADTTESRHDELGFRLSLTLAEQLGLTLANLNLRASLSQQHQQASGSA